jgi:hypothetical protein
MYTEIDDGGGMETTTATLNLSKAVRLLNAQHRNTSAGFYGSRIGGRYFRARAKAGVLQVFDFDVWTDVPAADAVFHDHNGQDIPLE